VKGKGGPHRRPTRPVAPRASNARPASARDITRPAPAADELLSIPLPAIDLICLALTAVLLVIVLLGVSGPLRILLALAFTTAVPGWAAVRVVGMANSATGALMAIPFSLVICTGTATIMVWTRAWNPVGMLDVVGLLSIAMIGWSGRGAFRTAAGRA